MKANAKDEQKIFWSMYDEILIQNGEPFVLLHEKNGEVTFWGNVNKYRSLVDLSLSMDFLVSKKFLRINIYIRDDVRLYNYLYSKKDEINTMLGFEPLWNDNCCSDNTRRIEVRLPFIPEDYDDYDRLINASLPIIMQYKKVFER